jgi:hypothetical protein
LSYLLRRCVGNIPKNEFYVRDVSGKEIAIYQDTTLYQWNVWGLDNAGKTVSISTMQEIEKYYQEFFQQYKYLYEDEVSITDPSYYSK